METKILILKCIQLPLRPFPKATKKITWVFNGGFLPFKMQKLCKTITGIIKQSRKIPVTSIWDFLNKGNEMAIRLKIQASYEVYKMRCNIWVVGLWVCHLVHTSLISLKYNVAHQFLSYWLHWNIDLKLNINYRYFHWLSFIYTPEDGFCKSHFKRQSILEVVPYWLIK